MQVRIVEELALNPPRVVVHLLPLGARIRSHFDVFGVQRARTSGRAATGRGGGRSRRWSRVAAAGPAAGADAGGIGRSV